MNIERTNLNIKQRTITKAIEQLKIEQLQAIEEKKAATNRDQYQIAIRSIDAVVKQIVKLRSELLEIETQIETINAQYPAVTMTAMTAATA